MAISYEILRRGDPEYPERLNHLPNPPRQLYLGGDRLLLRERMVAIIGSRDCSEYGAGVAERLAAELSRAGVVILSGLARGIDGYAHRGAMLVAGRTVAVLGTGIDVIYPKRNRAIQEDIAERGLLLTEYPPGSPAYHFHFPERNRLIAALAEVLVVVEAAVKSGTARTIRVATELGREIMAVPGPISRSTSSGTNALIRDGAGIVLGAEDVLYELGIRPAQPVAPVPHSGAVPDVALQAVWQELSDEPVHVDDLAARSGLPSRVTAECLLELEIAGWARQLPGARFVVTARFG